MIESSAAFKEAIKGDSRKIYVKAVVDITDPDIEYGEVSTSAETWFSKKEQLTDKKLSADNNYETLEHNRWLLNGDGSYVPENANEIKNEIGFVSEAVSGENGYFAEPVQIELNFSNVSVLQAFMIVFPTEENDGYGKDFELELFSKDKIVFSKSISDNTESICIFEGFTVENPTKISVHIFRWSRPERRARVMEIVPGVYEEWGNNELAQFNITQQADITNMSVRYGTASLKIDNQSKRFAPRNKAGIFKSLEERQGVELSVGVRLPNGETEYKKSGIFYQYEGGWKTAENGLLITWQLVDIIGLVSNREFIPPETLPTTLEGWVAAVISQLGSNFEKKYKVHEAYANAPVVASSLERIKGRPCGDILRFACMAAGTWMRADSITGYLTVEPLQNSGNSLDLDNMKTLPIIKGNNDLAALIINVFDGGEETKQLVFGGSDTAAENTANVDNPFIRTDEAAAAAAQSILTGYGGNQIETNGRGDPSSEIGDLDIIFVEKNESTLGRRIKQTLNVANGVMSNCKSTFLEVSAEEVEVI